MTITEAKKFGRSKTMKATTIVLAILIALLLISETRGDFANGILFFLQEVFDVNSIIILCILFGLTYLFGSYAGQEIILKRRMFLLVSLKYVFIISLAITAYTVMLGIFREGWIAGQPLLKTFFLPLFFKIFFCLLLGWLWATNKMRAFNKIT